MNNRKLSGSEPLKQPPKKEVRFNSFQLKPNHFPLSEAQSITPTFQNRTEIETHELDYYNLTIQLKEIENKILAYWFNQVPKYKSRTEQQAISDEICKKIIEDVVLTLDQFIKDRFIMDAFKKYFNRVIEWTDSKTNQSHVKDLRIDKPFFSDYRPQIFGHTKLLLSIDPECSEAYPIYLEFVQLFDLLKTYQTQTNLLEHKDQSDQILFPLDLNTRHKNRLNQIFGQFAFVINQVKNKNTLNALENYFDFFYKEISKKYVLPKKINHSLFRSVVVAQAEKLAPTPVTHSAPDSLQHASSTSEVQQTTTPDSETWKETVNRAVNKTTGIAQNITAIAAEELSKVANSVLGWFNTNTQTRAPQPQQSAELKLNQRHKTR